MRTDYSLNLAMESASVLIQSFDQLPLRTNSELAAMAFESNNILLTLEEDGILRRWDLQENKEIFRTELEPMVPLWRFSRDGKVVVGATDSLSIFDTSSGDLIWEAPAQGWATAVDISPENGVLASGHDDGRVRLWEKGGNKPAFETHLSTTGISAIEFSTDGNKLAIATEDCLIHILDAKSLKHLGKLTGHKDRVPAIAWSNEGDRLYSAGWDTTVRVWDALTFKPIILLNTHAVQVQTLALSPDGEFLASSDSDLLVRVWSTRKYTEATPTRELSEEIRFLAFSPNGQQLAGGGFLHVSLWDIQAGSLGCLPTHPGVLQHQVKFHQATQTLFCLNPGSPLQAWDVTSGKPANAFDRIGSLVTFDLSPEGKLLAGSFILESQGKQDYSPSCTLGIWHSDNAHLDQIFDSSSVPATAIAFSPDSKLVAYGSLLSSDARVWDIAGGEPKFQLSDIVQGFSLSDLKFLPQGNILAVSGLDWFASSGKEGIIALWNLESGLKEHSWDLGATQLAISANGNFLACALPRKQVHILCLKTRKCLAKLTEFQNSVSAIAFSPDSSIFAAASDDQQIRFWEAGSSRFLGTLMLEFRVKAIVFNQDSTNLFALGGDGFACQLDIQQFLESNS